MVLQNYQNSIEMTSNMIYIVALGSGFKCPHKIHLNTQCPESNSSGKSPSKSIATSLLIVTHHLELLEQVEANIFELRIMLKSGLEFFILKSYYPLYICCCPVQKNLPRKAELTWQVSRYL